MTNTELWQFLDTFEKNVFGLNPSAFTIINDAYLNDEISFGTQEVILESVEGSSNPGLGETVVLNYSTNPPVAEKCTNLDDPNGAFSFLFSPVPKVWATTAFGIFRCKVQGAFGIGTVLSVGPTPGILVDSAAKPVGICLEAGNNPTPGDVYVFVKTYKF